jgi:ribonucrease Y
MADNQDLIALEKKLLEREEKLEAERQKLDELKGKYQEKLEKVSGLSVDQAKKELFDQLELSESKAAAKIIKDKEDEAKATADRKSQEILVDSMRFGALKFIAEYTVSVVRIPEEEIKGRIIGKEGRNIRTFEQVTGVDVDLDEEGVIRLSSFDQIRREVARRSLEKLIKDTRIQPFRIEEIVEETKKEVERIMFEEGERLAHEAGVFNLSREIMSVLGRFKFRTSFGQNLIVHTLEDVKIGVHIAEELGANVNIVRIGCLFHDIGKVLEGEGSHVTLGVEFLKKNGIPEQVINCVAEHHEDKPFTSIESIVVHIADQISGARPGARYEDVEEYGKRLREMEEIAKKHEGVEDAYAFEAGRELRVIINPGKLTDEQTTVVAAKIRDEVAASQAVPGEIKVTAIREFRITATEFSN